MFHVREEPTVEITASGFEHTCHHFDAGVAKFFDPLSGNKHVAVDIRDHDFLYVMFYKHVGAGRSFAVVGARFKIDIHG